MLPEGIYEQIVNKRIGNELAKIDTSQYDVALEELNADDARRILSVYISYIIQRGLRYIRDSFPATEDREALIKQIQLCNDIITEVQLYTEEPDFEDSLILEKGEILTSLYEKLNTVRGISKRDAARPITSIVQNALFTGAQNEPSMLSELKKEIMSSDAVDLLVSFIRWSAIRPLLPELTEFTKREGTKLRVIATTYTQATEYKAILTLAKLPHTEVRINYETNHARMHAKAYLFKRQSGFTTAYIGSSNLSNPALNGGLEWNVKVTEQESFDIVKKFIVSFESYWNDSSFELFDPNDPECCRRLKEELSKPNYDLTNQRQLHLEFRPYAYQQEVLDQLEAEREYYGRYKNLVVAATGVGKTIIAAFDYKRYKESHEHARLLFVAHRKEILEQSIQKFQEVLNDFNFGQLYVGGIKPQSIEHLFVSIQSLNAGDLTAWTSKDYYDFIIVDEFHHAAAKSYQQLLSYYEPKILLGLTATPDRMDGKDILKYFNGKIASKMLLGEAIDRNLLSTFQYFGVTDDIDYRKVHWTRGRYDANELENLYTADQKRCSLILNSVLKYVSDIDDVKGLGFCVSVKHAEYMARYFNANQIPSVALSSGSVDDIREDAKHDLVSGKIRFIFVVDLYNEGVDIPEVNTVLFLRPTESATVFIQQLGRGLRLCKGKDCLTVLDFIGQANRQYKIATKFEALAGSGRKSIRSQVETGFSNLPRGCYIELETYAREYILENLKQTDNTKKALIDNVRTFTNDTGLELNLENFLTTYNMSLYAFYQNNGGRSLYRLRKWAGLIQDSRDVEDRIYSAITGLFHINSARLLDYWIRYINGDHNPVNESEILMRNMLYYTFFRVCPKSAGCSSIDAGIASILHEDFIKQEVLEILQYNRNHLDMVGVMNEYAFTCPLEVHCNYNMNQILAAYGYYNEDSSPHFQEGVKWLAEKNTDFFLINLNKSEKEFSPSTMYDDYAINSTLFHWQSQSQDREASDKIQRYIHHDEKGTNVSLFVREFKKNGTYTAPYVFLGNADHVSHEGEKPVSFVWKLHVPIPAELLPKANKSIAV